MNAKRDRQLRPSGSSGGNEAALVRRSIALRSRSHLLAVPLAVLMLAGCAASTQVVRNEHLSKDVKGRNYKEVLLIPPKSDSRNVVPRVVTGLENMGLKVRLMDPEKPFGSSGTGFLIGADGFLLTCAHVVDDEKEATVTLDGKRYLADVVKSDKDADLALLKLREALPASAAVLSFRGSSRSYSMGEDVYTIGYPLSRMLGTNARMTKGVVSATTGLRDDPKTMQISAEIQPGNSGGPLLDHDGQVIGVIQQTINPWRVAESTGGALPQNVNFSLKNDAVVEFVKGASDPTFQELRYDKGGGLEAASHAVARVQAGIVEDSDQHDKLVVRLIYVSIWDMWYRFRVFVLAAFDYDTQEALFAAGQGRDNLVSDEEVVIKDTMAQFRKAIASQ